MCAIEAGNPGLKGVLPKEYARPVLNKVVLGELVDLHPRQSALQRLGLGRRPAARGRPLEIRRSPTGNANYAWLQHIHHHLAPRGTAGVVLANGSMSSGQSGEGNIRRAMVEADVVDCMIALPGQLFHSTQIPACLWFLSRSKNPGKGWRDRRGEVLFIDARKLGHMVDRTRRELAEEDIGQVARTYHAWRGEKDAGGYQDLPGFCRAATLAEIGEHNYVLTPERYVGAEATQDDGEPFEDKMQRLGTRWLEQQAQAVKLDAAIKTNLKSLGFDPEKA